MNDELWGYFTDQRQNSGLLVAEAPTGYGKTYQTVQAMYRCIREGGPQKFMFVTNLVKNLPTDELKRAYAADGHAEDYEKDVLVLESPVETIQRVIDTVDVPVPFRTPAYEALKKSYAQLKSYRSYDKSLRAKLEEEERQRLREELEPAFRRELAAQLNRRISTSPTEKREAIRHDRQYQWIQKFYPAVFWNDYPILLLTVKKLMVRNIPLVEPGFPCLSDRMLEGRIVCIDEFDASKSVILDHLIDQALNVRVDYLELFRQIHSRMAEHQPSRALSDARDVFEKRSKRSWTMLLQEAQEIYAYGALAFSIKTADDSIDRGRNFLFHDTSYHTVLHGNRAYLRVARDDSLNQVRIHFEDHATHEKHRSEPNIQLQRLLRDIHVFLHHFQTYVYGWGKAYADMVNHGRRQTDDLYTSALAVESIYQDYGLNSKQVSLMTEDLSRSTRQSSYNFMTPDLSFYESGFRFFEFTDDEHHHTKTDLQYFQMQNTPEKVLLYLCRKVKVVGLSATAALPTVTGNYDLDYLRSQLKDHYRELSPDAKARMAAELQNQWKCYANHQVNVELSVVDRGKSGATTQERLREIFTEEALARKYELQLTDNPYYQKRYCNIFAVMRAFWEHREIHSFLCLNKMLPEPGKEKMDLQLLQQVFDDLRCQFAPDDRGELCVLRSGTNFEDDKNALLDALSRGEKRFILSSYQTLGAGQNLQYSVHSKQGLISLLEGVDAKDDRLAKKDIDALYLGEDTHAAVTLSYDTPLCSKELLQFCFQAECLHESSEISRQTLDKIIKEAVTNYAGQKSGNITANTALWQCPSIHRQVSRDMIQAVGRMNRTFLKNPTVYLFTCEDALLKMDPSCLRGRILTPEMQALANARFALGTEYSVPNEAQNRAERISDCGNRYIQRMLQAEWTSESMALWRGLRNTVLTHPRATQQEWADDPIIRNYYIYLGESKSRYYFAQKGDFADTMLSLDGDKAAFSARLADWMVPSEVSEEQSRLQTLLSYPGLRDYFTAQGWATEFGGGAYIMSPVLFQNIYKGALGEEAGRFILERELSIQCQEIDDPAQFEIFDYTLGDGIYLDFKHWKARTAFDEQQMRRKILQKMERVPSRRALLINLISDGNSAPTCIADGKLVEIPGLLLPDGTPDRTALRYIKEMIL